MPALPTQPEQTAEEHVIPPAVQMVQLLAGFQLSQALYAAAKLGIADCLRSGPKDAAALAADVSADTGSLHRVLRALASIGVFTESPDGLFGLSSLGETLTQDSPASMRDLAIMWMETHYGPFGGLLDTVRTGRCAATTFYGQPFFSWLGSQPEHIQRFSRAMANLTDGVKLGAISSGVWHGCGLAWPGPCAGSSWRADEGENAMDDSDSGYQFGTGIGDEDLARLEAQGAAIFPASG